MFRVASMIPAACRTQSRFLIRNPNVLYELRLGYSARPSFISRIVSNLKSEFEKNKEMKENIKKFREEREKLEQSEALKMVRRKFNEVSKLESSKSTEVLSDLKDRVSNVIDEAAKTKIAQKAKGMSEKYGQEISEFGKGVSKISEDVGQKIGQSDAFKIVKNEIKTETIHGQVYRSPEKLRKRIEMKNDSKIQENTEATGVELHKDSRFNQSWEHFKNNNQYVNKMLDWKMRYDESDNVMVRFSRLLTDKVSGMFTKTDLSETLTEICNVDPSFNEKQFLRDCETDIIPNILEAMVRGDLEILKDWCFESTYNNIATPILQAQKAGYYLHSKILDIEHVDLAMGKVMEQGPVLIITFQAQQIMCVRNAKHEVIEGDPDKVMRVNYVWVLCRDLEEMNPKSAWRLMELSANSSEQLL